MLGLATKDEVKAKKPESKKQASGASEEAKEILAKMEAKKDAGDCPFC